jgi:NADH dehydrogenase
MRVFLAGATGAIGNVPGVALPQGRTLTHAARPLRRRPDQAPAARRDDARFRHRDKGNLSTIGRSRAVADVKGMHLSGFVAWVTWLAVHLFYLIGFQNRFLVLLRWSVSYLTRGRGARLLGGRAADGS